jgi:hypothetical protein
MRPSNFDQKRFALSSVGRNGQHRCLTGRAIITETPNSFSFEAHLSAQQTSPKAQSWLSSADAHARRTSDHLEAPGAWACAAFRLA